MYSEVVAVRCGQCQEWKRQVRRKIGNRWRTYWICPTCDSPKVKQARRYTQ